MVRSEYCEWVSGPPFIFARADVNAWERLGGIKFQRQRMTYAVTLHVVDADFS